MDLLLHDKHVLITGGSRGIGYACAYEFLREGCKVSIVGRDRARIDEACAKLDDTRTRISGFDADLSNPDAALDMIDRAEHAHGPIDVLVNAAGAARQKPFAELTPQDWMSAMQAKFHAYINVIDPVIKRMAARSTGAIVNIVGLGGKVPISTHLPGGAANAALMLATAGLAMAYGPLGVRVNALNPARTATGRLAEGIDAQARQRNVSAETAAAQSVDGMGRPGTPEEVAAAVVFLASPRAGYISGAIVNIDGARRPTVV